MAWPGAHPVTNGRLSERQNKILEALVGRKGESTTVELLDVLGLTCAPGNLNVTLNNLQYKLPGVYGCPYRIRKRRVKGVDYWRVIDKSKA